MSVILEFTIEPDEFALGQGLDTHTGGRIDLEEVVAADEYLTPFVWVEGDDPVQLEDAIHENGYIENLTVLDTVGDRTLFRVEWSEMVRSDDVLEGIKRHEATILEVHGDESWYFRLRFIDHQRITEFYDFCSTKEIPLRVDRVYRPTDESQAGRLFGLTSEQREALVLALESGYFATPRQTSTQVLADEFDISQQAMSDRIRRGTEKVLRSVLRYN